MSVFHNMRSIQSEAEWFGESWSRADINAVQTLLGGLDGPATGFLRVTPLFYGAQLVLLTTSN